MDSPGDSDIAEQALLPSSTSHEQDVRTAVLWPLYCSHFLSTWNTRSFEFGAVLFLATIYPGTLMAMSIYALFRALAAIVLSPMVGKYIDTRPRLEVVRVSIVGQRIAVMVSCLAFLFLLSTMKSKSWKTYVGFSVLVVLACIEKLCSIMNLVSVERDWVVVMADGNDDQLQMLNAKMRRIDLFCKLAAPLVISVFDSISTRLAVLVTLGLNGASTAIEYFLIAYVHRRNAALSWRKPSSEVDESSATILPPFPTSSISTLFRQYTRPLTHAIKIYVSSPAFLPSFALSLLYLTVLSFSSQMTTLLLSTPTPRITSTTIALLRTLSAIFELTSTFIAPFLSKRIGPIRTGIWCLSWQSLCLSLAVLPFYATHLTSSAPIILLITFTLLSRPGLFAYDLTAQLLIQNSLSGNPNAGTFSTTESALQNFFELLSFVSTIIFPEPSQFRSPAAISLCATIAAAAVYACYVRRRRGHLIHCYFCSDGVGKWGGYTWMHRDSEVQVDGRDGLGAYGLMLGAGDNADGRLGDDASGTGLESTRARLDAS